MPSDKATSHVRLLPGSGCPATGPCQPARSLSPAAQACSMQSPLHLSRRDQGNAAHTGPRVQDWPTQMLQTKSRLTWQNLIEESSWTAKDGEKTTAVGVPIRQVRRPAGQVGHGGHCSELLTIEPSRCCCSSTRPSLSRRPSATAPARHGSRRRGRFPSPRPGLLGAWSTSS